MLPKCIKCNLHKNCITNMMPGDGPEDADVMIIGEAPGREEDEQGKPFVGKAGKILMEALNELGFKREDFFITNVIRCRPTDGTKNLTPEDKDIELCREWLLKEIEEVDPKLIVLLGGRAIDGVLGLGEGKGITQKSGTFVDRDNRTYLRCIHPASVIYNPNQKSKFKRDLGKLKEFFEGREKVDLDYGSIKSLSQFKEFAKMLEGCEVIAVDIETDGTDFLEDSIIGISFAWELGKSRYLPLPKDEFDFLSGKSAGWRDKAIEVLKEIMANESLKVFHNAAFDVKFLNRAGCPVNNSNFDTMIAAHIIDENQRKALDFLADVYTDLSGHKMELKDYVKKAGGKKVSYSDVPLSIMIPYCCGDSDATLRLYHIFREKLKEIKLTNYFYKFQMPLRGVLNRMEEAGVRVDSDLADALSIKASNKMINIEGQIKRLMADKGYPKSDTINIGSPKQLTDYFFSYLKLKSTKKTEGGKSGEKKFSIDESVLRSFQNKYDEAKYILAYRKYAKLLGTYIEPINNLTDKDGRIHCHFNQAKARTGRLACSDPNLQTIPTRSEEILGEEILSVLPVKNLFITEEGHTFLIADYSQVELRVLANYAKDPNMIQSFADGKDIHAMTAHKLFGLSDDTKETKTQRIVAKTVNFGIPYQITPKGLLDHIKKGAGEFKDDGSRFTIKDAEEYINNFFIQFPRTEDWIEEIKREAVYKGYVTNHFGRRRRFPGITLDNDVELRQVVNYPIQGTAADICLMAMNRIQKMLDESEFLSRMILNVHDNIIFECPDEEVEELAPLIKEKMEKPIKGIEVPLKVDFEIGKCWGTAEGYEV